MGEDIIRYCPAFPGVRGSGHRRCLRLSASWAYGDDFNINGIDNLSILILVVFQELNFLSSENLSR